MNSIHPKRVSSDVAREEVMTKGSKAWFLPLIAVSVACAIGIGFFFTRSSALAAETKQPASVDLPKLTPREADDIDWYVTNVQLHKVIHPRETPLFTFYFTFEFNPSDKNDP